MDDFVAFCVACGCGVKTSDTIDDEDNGRWYRINNEDFHVMGRFSTSAQRELFESNLQGPKARVDQETLFFTAMANPCWDGGTKVNFLSSQLQFHYWPLYRRISSKINRSFPIHASCLQVLDRYVESSCSQPKKSESILQSRECFYNALCKQQEHNDNINIDNANLSRALSLLNPHVDTNTYPGKMWKLEDGEQWDPSWAQLVRSSKERRCPKYQNLGH